MSEKVLCEKSDLVAIADAVREATGSTENYNVSELSAATVEAISNANLILQDKTVTPTALDQIITPDSNYDGLSQVIVKGDVDLKAENITEGVTIFDVTGSNPYEKTATDTEVNAQANLISQIATALEGKAAGGGSVETCTVKIIGGGPDPEGCSIYGYVALLGDNTIVEHIETTNGPQEITINNVRCNSLVLVPCSARSGYYLAGMTTNGDATLVQNFSEWFVEAVVHVKGKQNDTITITIEVEEE